MKHLRAFIMFPVEVSAILLGLVLVWLADVFHGGGTVLDEWEAALARWISGRGAR